jgi:hypothetical protein
MCLLLLSQFLKQKVLALVSVSVSIAKVPFFALLICYGNLTSYSRWPVFWYLPAWRCILKPDTLNGTEQRTKGPLEAQFHRDIVSHHRNDNKRQRNGHSHIILNYESWLWAFSNQTREAETENSRLKDFIYKVGYAHTPHCRRQSV